jgi:hypothetical protein
MWIVSDQWQHSDDDIRSDWDAQRDLLTDLETMLRQRQFTTYAK